MYGIPPIEENEVGPMSSWVNDDAWEWPETILWSDENTSEVSEEVWHSIKPKKTFIIDIGKLNEQESEDIIRKFQELMNAPTNDRDYFIPDDFSLEDEVKEIPDSE